MKKIQRINVEGNRDLLRQIGLLLVPQNNRQALYLAMALVNTVSCGARVVVVPNIKNGPLAAPAFRKYLLTNEAEKWMGKIGLCGFTEESFSATDIGRVLSLLPGSIEVILNLSGGKNASLKSFPRWEAAADGKEIKAKEGFVIAKNAFVMTGHFSQVVREISQQLCAGSPFLTPPQHDRWVTFLEQALSPSESDTPLDEIAKVSSALFQEEIQTILKVIHPWKAQYPFDDELGLINIWNKRKCLLVNGKPIWYVFDYRGIRHRLSEAAEQEGQLPFISVAVPREAYPWASYFESDFAKANNGMAEHEIAWLGKDPKTGNPTLEVRHEKMRDYPEKELTRLCQLVISQAAQVP